MRVLLTYENTHRDKQPKDEGILLLKTTPDRTQLVAWARELYRTGKFRESTAFSHGLDAATAAKTLVESGKLRIDRQRVIGVNETTVTTNQYAIGKDQSRQFFATRAEAERALGKKKAKILELTTQVTRADHVWTLFAAQVVATHNQVFVYNNMNFLAALGEDAWVAIWTTTLEGACTAIISRDAKTVPNGIEAAYDATSDFVAAT